VQANDRALITAAPEPRLAPTDRAHVLAIAPTSFFGDYGCHVRIFEEARVLARHGIHTAIVTYPFGRPIEDLRLYRSPRLFGQRRVDPGSSPQKFSLDAVLVLNALRAAAIERPALVHGHLHEGALIGWLVAKMFRIPLVFDFQGSLTAEMVDHNFLRPGSPAYHVFRTLERRIVGLPDAIVTSTASGAAVLINEFGCDPARVTVVPDGVDTNRFRPEWETVNVSTSPLVDAEPGRQVRVDNGQIRRSAQIKASLGIPANRPVVVYLGLLAEYQGSSHLLQAAQALIRRGVDAHFLIMGFPGQELYGSVAHALGIQDHVTFTGAVPYERAPEYLSVGTIAVAPKISETEGNGKVLNYMAMGLPTVTFETHASQEILGDLGIYAARGDWADLAAKIEKALSSPAWLQQRSQALRENALAHHTWERSSEALIEAYRRVAL
jgi:glycosyltransferase involved in cell wall biosynthesis